MFRSVFILSGAFVLWAGIHSLLASMTVKGWVRQILGSSTDRWYRLAFNAIAGITVLPSLALVVLLPDQRLYVIPEPWRWLTLGVQGLAFIALLWAFAQVRPMHFFGLTQLLSAKSEKDRPLYVRGFYCYLRHPLYFFSLILIWMMPIMTVNLATINVLITLYFYLGSILEENKLLAEFGTAYAAYQQRVPRLIPRLRLCNLNDQDLNT